MKQSTQTMEITMISRESGVSTSINLRRLAQELGKLGKNIKEEEIVLTPNPAFENPQIVKEYQEVVKGIINADKYANYDPDKPTLNAWARADIKYRLGKSPK